MADEKAAGIISVDHLAGAITEAVLRAAGTRLDLEKHIAAGHVVIFNPIIRYGGPFIIAKNIDLAKVIGGGTLNNEG